MAGTGLFVDRLALGQNGLILPVVALLRGDPANPAVAVHGVILGRGINLDYKYPDTTYRIFS